MYRNKWSKVGVNGEGFALTMNEQEKILHGTEATEGTRSVNAPLKRATALGWRSAESGLGKG